MHGPPKILPPLFNTLKVLQKNVLDTCHHEYFRKTQFCTRNMLLSDVHVYSHWCSEALQKWLRQCTGETDPLALSDSLALSDFRLDWVICRRKSEKQSFSYVARKEYTRFSQWCIPPARWFKHTRQKPCTASY